MKMMKVVCIVMLSIPALLRAEVGVVTRVVGPDAKIIREGSSLPVFQNTQLEEGDRIETNNSVVLLQVYPSTQINLSENSVFVIEEHDVEFEGNNETSDIIMGFLKGKLKILVKKLRDEDVTSQTLKTNMVSLAVRGTEFEVEESDEGTNVDVIEGSVAAVSETESVELNKDVSIEIKKKGQFRLAQGLRKGRKLIKQEWRLNFNDNEQARQRWRERRTDIRHKYFKVDPVIRLQRREEKRLKRAARLEARQNKGLNKELKKELKKEFRKDIKNRKNNR